MISTAITINGNNSCNPNSNNNNNTNSSSNVLHEGLRKALVGAVVGEGDDGDLPGHLVILCYGMSWYSV